MLVGMRSQWPNWLRQEYGKLEICGSSPGYDTNFSLKNYQQVVKCFRCEGFDLAVEYMKWLSDVYRGEFYDFKNKQNE